MPPSELIRSLYLAAVTALFLRVLVSACRMGWRGGLCTYPGGTGLLLFGEEVEEDGSGSKALVEGLGDVFGDGSLLGNERLFGRGRILGGGGLLGDRGLLRDGRFVAGDGHLALGVVVGRSPKLGLAFHAIAWRQVLRERAVQHLHLSSGDRTTEELLDLGVDLVVLGGGHVVRFGRWMRK